MTLFEIIELLGTFVPIPWFWLALLVFGTLIGTVRNGLSGLPMASIKTAFVFIAPIAAYIFTFPMLDERELHGIRGWYHWHTAAAPLLLWSGICWFGLEVYRLQHPPRYWLIIGQCVGSLLCVINLLLGVYIYIRWTGYEFNDKKIGVLILLTVASGLALWHGLRSVNVLLHTNLSKTRIVLFTTAAMLLWLMAGTAIWFLNTTGILHKLL